VFAPAWRMSVCPPTIPRSDDPNGGAQPACHCPTGSACVLTGRRCRFVATRRWREARSGNHRRNVRDVVCGMVASARCVPSATVRAAAGSVLRRARRYARRPEVQTARQSVSTPKRRVLPGVCSQAYTGVSPAADERMSGAKIRQAERQKRRRACRRSRRQARGCVSQKKCHAGETLRQATGALKRRAAAGQNVFVPASPYPASTVAVPSGYRRWSREGTEIQAFIQPLQASLRIARVVAR